MDTMTVKTMQPGTHVDITISGHRNAVKRAVARLHGLDNEYSVDVRPSTNDDGSYLVVDRDQAESYPAYLAEVVTSGDVGGYCEDAAHHASRVRRAGDTATIAQPFPAPDGTTMTVGTEDAKEMPPGLAEELAGMTGDYRHVAERIADLPLVDPAPGYEERAVARAKRDDVLR